MSKSDETAPLDVSVITRRPAASGAVSFGDPVVLHDSSMMKITLVPFYIKRSNGTDLAVKLLTYKKGKLGWFAVEERSLSLNESAARALLQALRAQFAVADHDDDGGYIAIRVVNGVAEIGNADPAVIAQAVVSVLEKEDIASHLAGAELSGELVHAFRGAIRLKEMRSAVATLRAHLDGGEIDEATYQRWCEKHSWAFGNAYVLRDEVRDLSPGDSLDLLLPTVMTGFRDIVELKRPDMAVLLYDKAHKNYYFSADVSRALGQVHRYLDVLAEVAANGLRDHPEIVAYKPRAMIVIGRSSTWTEGEIRSLHGLNSRLHGITVMTYDQLLSQGERLIEMLGAELSGAEEHVDDIPFENEEDFGF